MTTKIGELPQLDAVVLAEDPEVAAQVGPLVTPAADPDVDMVALRKDPAVPAWHRAQLENEPPVP